MLKAAVGENSVIYRKVNRQNFCKRYAVVILVLTGLVFAIGGIVCGVTKVFEDWVEREIKKVLAVYIYCLSQSNYCYAMCCIKYIVCMVC